MMETRGRDGKWGEIGTWGRKEVMRERRICGRDGDIWVEK